MVLEFAASLLSLMKALPEPKPHIGTINLAGIDKCMIDRDLSLSRNLSRLTSGQLGEKAQLHNNAHSLHSPAKSKKSQSLQTPSPWRVLADQGLVLDSFLTA